VGQVRNRRRSIAPTWAAIVRLDFVLRHDDAQPIANVA